MKKTFSSPGWIIGITAIIVLVIIIVFIKTNTANPTPANTNRQIVMDCTADMYTQFHIHPHLRIIVNGQEQVIPANIGITDTCMKSIHTHDETGIIHVEAPEKRDYTLADFFAVWRKPYGKDQILDYKADSQYIIRQIINGKESEDFENTILVDKDQIVIRYDKR